MNNVDYYYVCLKQLSLLFINYVILIILEEVTFKILTLKTK